MSYFRSLLMANQKANTPSGKLPEGYIQVEWIKNKWDAYIDTGIICSMSNKYIIEFQQQYDANYRIWGATNQSSYIGINYSLTWGDDSYWVRCEHLYNEQRYLSLMHYDRNKHIVELSKDGFIIDGINKGLSEGFKEDFNLKYTAYLFTLNPAGTSTTTHLHGKIFSYKVYDKTNKLIQDFIPCISPNKEVGMFDAVNGKFYGSANATKFISGPVKGNNPIYVNWVGSDGTAYIDTDVVNLSAKDGKIELGFTYSKYIMYGGIFADYVDLDTDSTRMILGESQNTMITDYMSFPRVSVKITCNIDAMHDVTIKFGKCYNNGYDNNIGVNRGKKNTSSIKLFKGNMTSYRNIGARIYYFKYYIADKLIKDFRPCLDPITKEPCFYENVEGKYYYKQGGGKFTHGEIIN